MIMKFLSNISGKRVQILQRQRSSNSIGSYKNSPKSNCSTPKHKPSSSLSQKSSCIKTQDGMSTKERKKMSRVEFDFSYQKSSDIVRFCPKHNCCTQNASSSSSTTSTLPIDIPPSHHNRNNFDDTTMTSKSFTIYESMNRIYHRTSLPNCQSKSLRCESLIANITPPSSSNCSSIKSSSETATTTSTTSKSTQIQCETPPSRINVLNLDNFKSAKRKVPIKNFPQQQQHSNLEIQAMKEKIAQAEIFLEAMGNASTTKNRDSSRYVRPPNCQFIISSTMIYL